MPDTERYKLDGARMDALAVQLDDELDRAPTSARYPPDRERAAAPGGVGPEYHQADRHANYTAATLTLAAGTAFQEVVRFAGAADELHLWVSAGGVEWRLGRRGRTPYDAFVANTTDEVRITVPVEIVEARDPAGVGAQVVRVTGRYIRRDPPAAS